VPPRATVTALMKRFSVSVLLSTILACGGGEGGDDTQVDALSASCMEAVQHSDLAWLQEKIFTPSCSAFSACHKGAALEAGGLSLEPNQTIAQTVGVDSEMFPQYKRIVAGDPASSYMMIILGEYPGMLDPDVGTMPYNNPKLCQEKLDAVERWIMAGATATTPVDAGVDAPLDAI